MLNVQYTSHLRPKLTIIDDSECIKNFRVNTPE